MIRPDPPTCLRCGAPVTKRRFTRCKSCAERERWQNPDDPRRAQLAERNRGASSRPYEDRDWFEARYIGQCMSLRDVAAAAGCSLRTAARWRALHGLPARGPGERIRPRLPLDGSVRHDWKGRTICPDCGRRKSYSGARCRACKCRTEAEAGVADVVQLVRQWTFDHWRPLIFDRDGYACQDCGDAHGGNLHAHHIRPLALVVRDLRIELAPDLGSAAGRYAFAQALIASPVVSSPTNGVTLCDSCHRRRHAETQSVKAQLKEAA